MRAYLTYEINSKLLTPNTCTPVCCKYTLIFCISWHCVNVFHTYEYPLDAIPRDTTMALYSISIITSSLMVIIILLGFGSGFTSSMNLSTNNYGINRTRVRRDLWQLYNVISCSMPCDPLVLKDYGCYCGLGGAGLPVDPIDKCCMLHDNCYQLAPCHQSLTYFLPYNWYCIEGRAQCVAVSSSKWSYISSCAYSLCECDRIFSECIKSYGCPSRRAFCRSAQLRSIWQRLLASFGLDFRWCNLKRTLKPA